MVDECDVVVSLFVVWFIEVMGVVYVGYCQPSLPSRSSPLPAVWCFVLAVTCLTHRHTHTHT